MKRKEGQNNRHVLASLLLRAHMRRLGACHTASLSECVWTCTGANESCGMRSNYRLGDDLMAEVLFIGQRDSDVRKNVGSTEIIMNRLCRDEMKAGLSSFEELRLDT